MAEILTATSGALPDPIVAPRVLRDVHRANRLLAALPGVILDQLTPHLSVVELARDTVVSEAHEPAAHVLFPHSGVVSIVAMDADGQGVEVAIVGREGVTGVPFILGGETMANSAVVQVQLRASRMKAAIFRRAVETMPDFKSLMLRYVLAVINQISQNAACNQLHPIERRCARWLLSAHERVDGDSFELTQQYLAVMLGVTRPSVSAAASHLQRAGLIRYTRGRLTVLDRTGLEHASCGCFRIIEDGFEELRGSR